MPISFPGILSPFTSKNCPILDTYYPYSDISAP